MRLICCTFSIKKNVVIVQYSVNCTSFQSSSSFCINFSYVKDGFVPFSWPYPLFLIICFAVFRIRIRLDQFYFKLPSLDLFQWPGLIKNQPKIIEKYNITKTRLFSLPNRNLLSRSYVYRRAPCLMLGVLLKESFLYISLCRCFMDSLSWLIYSPAGIRIRIRSDPLIFGSGSYYHLYIKLSLLEQNIKNKTFFFFISKPDPNFF